MNVAIDIVSDLVCPWCFIGKHRLAQAIALTERSDDSLEFSTWDKRLAAAAEAEGLSLAHEVTN